MGGGGREAQWDGIDIAAGSVSWEALPGCPVIGTARGAGAALPLASVRPCGLRPPTELPQLGQEGGEAKC